MVVFDDMTAYILSNKHLQPIVTELFFRGRKLKISPVLLHKRILLYQKNRLNSKHYFIIKIRNKQELQQMGFNHSSDIDYENVLSLY